MMTIIIAFIGMLLGVDLGGLLGGKDKGPSYEQAANDHSPAAPDQQAAIDELNGRINKLEQDKDFSQILSNHGIDRSEFAKLLSFTSEPQRDRELVALNASQDEFVVLTPNARDSDMGNVAIYAKQAADGTLSDIQVATTGADGSVTVKAVDGNFTLSDGNEQAVGSAIMQEADHSGRVLDNNAANVVADNIVSTLRAGRLPGQDKGASR